MYTVIKMSLSKVTKFCVCPVDVMFFCLKNIFQLIILINTLINYCSEHHIRYTILPFITSNTQTQFCNAFYSGYKKFSKNPGYCATPTAPQIY